MRYLVQTELNPFSTDAMDQINAITDVARGAQPNTALADATVSMVGYTATLRDTRDYYRHDIRFIITVTVLVVLFTLIALLRAIVAPLYLVASVVISYLSALGIGVLVIQFLLGAQLHWTVPRWRSWCWSPSAPTTTCCWCRGCATNPRTASATG